MAINVKSIHLKWFAESCSGMKTSAAPCRSMTIPTSLLVPTLTLSRKQIRYSNNRLNLNDIIKYDLDLEGCISCCSHCAICCQSQNWAAHPWQTRWKDGHVHVSIHPTTEHHSHSFSWTVYKREKSYLFIFRLVITSALSQMPSISLSSASDSTTHWTSLSTISSAMKFHDSWIILAPMDLLSQRAKLPR